MDWTAMRARLHAVPGFGGDANKARRKDWIARALGYREWGPALDLFKAYAQATPEQRLHVERCLEEMERGS